jgi:hypothetical protein
MVRMSTAEKNGYKCPNCGDQLSQDRADKGFLRHMSIAGCPFERGQRDDREPSQEDGEVRLQGEG